MDDNYVLDWLKDYFNNPNLKEKELKPVLHFSLLWNLFEYTYFTDQNRLYSNALRELSAIASIKLERGKLDNIFYFFKDRYVNDSIKTDMNKKFKDLNLSVKENECCLSDYNFCRNILFKNNPTKKEQSGCIFLIIHRFRNNLFHGKKYPETLNIYEKPFKEINNFLIHFIGVTAKKDEINLNRFLLNATGKYQ